MDLAPNLKALPVASASWPRVAAWPRPPRRASRPATVTLAAPSQRGRYYSLALPAGATVALPLAVPTVWQAGLPGPGALRPGPRAGGGVCVFLGGPGRPGPAVWGRRGVRAHRLCPRSRRRRRSALRAQMSDSLTGHGVVPQVS